MPRSFDVWAMRSVAGLGQSMKETPAATCIAKAAHLAFAPAGRLVAVLGTVVHACGRFDENLLHMSELGNVSLRPQQPVNVHDAQNSQPERAAERRRIAQAVRRSAGGSRTFSVVNRF